MQKISNTYQHRFRIKLVLQVRILASIACQGILGQQFKRPQYHKEAPDKVVTGIYKGRELEFKSWSEPQKLLSLEKANLGKATLFGGADRSVVPYSGPSSKKQTVYVNRTFTTNSPHINAEVVVNESSFEAVSPQDMPYYFYNTKYFTNKGTFKAYDDLDFRNYQTFENLLGEWDYDPVDAKVFVNEETRLTFSRCVNMCYIGCYLRGILEPKCSQEVAEGSSKAVLGLPVGSSGPAGP